MIEKVEDQIEYERQRFKSAKILIWSCFFLYVMMMSSKNVYTAELVTLQSVFGTSKAQTSLAMTYYFITYAIAQMVLTALFGKINLRIFLFVTGSISAILTIVLGLSSSITTAYILCGVNGVLQAGIYSGCMGILAKYLPLKLLPYGNRVMQAGAVWGVISYGCSALFVGQGLWNVPFILLGALFLLSAVFFFYAAMRIKKFPSVVLEKNEPTLEKQIEKEKPFMEINRKKDKILFFVLMVAITGLSNVAYYFVVNWVPDMLHTVFNMPQEYSILITIVVPIISAMCSLFVISLCEKHEKILRISGIFLAVSTFFTLSLMFIYNYNLILSVVFIAISLATNVGGRAVLMGVMAFKMRTRINSGSYSALLNAFGAIIAGVIPPLVGALIDSFSGISGYGWSYLIASIIGTVAIVLLVVFATWHKKTSKKL